MRGIGLIILVTILVVLPIEARSKKYLIWLSDKNNTTYSLDEPKAYLSERAIQRRWNQGISIDSLDLPVVRTYIETIESLGVEVRCTSKWLNTITVMTDDSTRVAAIEKLTFVDSVNLTWVEPEVKSANSMAVIFI